MNLSPEQIQALDHGEAVAIIVEGRQCVVVIQEAYNRIRREIDDPREAYGAAIKAWDAYGSPEDATLYQDIE